MSFYFKKGWAVDLGGRYLKAENFDSTSGEFASGMLGISKEHKEMYMGLRAYYTQFKNTFYTGAFSTKNFISATLTSRFYMNKHTDYASVILGYGTGPDDFSRLYNLTQNINYTTVSAGAGYMKQFHYRTSLGLFGTWYNQKIGEKIDATTGAYNGIFVNQFDIFVTLLRKF